MINGRWGSYELDENRKPALSNKPININPLTSFSTLGNTGYYKKNRIPETRSPVQINNNKPLLAQPSALGDQAAFEAEFRKSQESVPATSPVNQDKMQVIKESFDPRGQLGMQMAGYRPMPDEYHDQRAGALQKFGNASVSVGMTPREQAAAAWIEANKGNKHVNRITLANNFTDLKGYEDRVNQRAQEMAGLKEHYGMYGNEYNTVDGAELKNREVAGKNYENLTQGANYDAEAANRRAALPFIGDKYKADIAGANAQAGLHTAQGVLAGVQADAGRQTMGVQKSALEGNENALAMLGQEKNKALYAGLPKVVEGVTDPTEINNRTNAYISAALEAQRAARQGKVYRQTSPALPASGFGPWKQEARNATYGY